MPLGDPFNMTQYAVFIHMVAQCVNMTTDVFIHEIGDCHVYKPQWEALDKQMARTPIDNSDPRIALTPGITDIDDFTFDDIRITGYKSHGPIKFPPAAV